VPYWPFCPVEHLLLRVISFYYRLYCLCSQINDDDDDDDDEQVRLLHGLK